MSEETTADRLLLVSDLCGVIIDPPAFIQPGESFWIDGSTLYVRSAAGDVRQVVGTVDEHLPGVGGGRRIVPNG